MSDCSFLDMIEAEIKFYKMLFNFLNASHLRDYSNPHSYTILFLMIRCIP